jgi:Tol biopolymer transport system component
LIGNPVKLSSGSTPGDESPAIAWSGRTLGMTWTQGDASTHRIMFRTFDQRLSPASDPVELTSASISGVYPTVIWNQSAYVIAFYDSVSPLRAVYGAVRSESAEQIVSTRPITSSPRHSRYPTMLPYGDRFLLVWSDDKDDNDGYELYSKMLDNDLRSLAGEDRLTYARGESITPMASFNPDGKVGILFRDDRDGSPQVYFTGMACTESPPVY